MRTNPSKTVDAEQAKNTLNSMLTDYDRRARDVNVYRLGHLFAASDRVFEGLGSEIPVDVLIRRVDRFFIVGSMPPAKRFIDLLKVQPENHSMDSLYLAGWPKVRAKTKSSKPKASTNPSRRQLESRQMRRASGRDQVEPEPRFAIGDRVTDGDRIGDVSFLVGFDELVGWKYKVIEPDGTRLTWNETSMKKVKHGSKDDAVLHKAMLSRRHSSKSSNPRKPKGSKPVKLKAKEAKVIKEILSLVPEKVSRHDVDEVESQIEIVQNQYHDAVMADDESEAKRLDYQRMFLEAKSNAYLEVVRGLGESSFAEAIDQQGEYGSLKDSLDAYEENLADTIHEIWGTWGRGFGDIALFRFQDMREELEAKGMPGKNQTIDEAMRSIGFYQTRMVGGSVYWRFDFSDDDYPFLLLSLPGGGIPRDWDDDNEEIEIGFYENDEDFEGEALIDVYKTPLEAYEVLRRSKDGDRSGLQEALLKSPWGLKKSKNPVAKIKRRVLR